MRPARSRRLVRALCLVASGLVALAACGSASGPQQVTASIASSRARRSEVRGSWPATTTTTIPQTPNLDPATGLGVSGPIGPPWPTSFMVADAKVPEVALYSKPGVRVPTNRTLPNPTVEHVPLVMLVRNSWGPWLQVQINTRPNGATAWINSADVTVRTVPNHILIELGARRLTVFHGDEAIWSTSVAPGKASSPTPTGAFYVDVLAKPYNPNGPYGIYQISFTGFSTVYEHFGSGNGQVAMHGTNRPELIGTPASHGCVRLSNADITTLLPMATQGTPVVVVA
jgi:lipoprotein-anchoring transpeptidase ErfK/SrfK